jgi:hypothetical protein
MFDIVPTPESSKIAEVGYDEGARELLVKSLDGDTSIYMNVPREEWDRLLNARSKGMYVNIILKPKYGRRPARRDAPAYPGQRK